MGLMAAAGVGLSLGFWPGDPGWTAAGLAGTAVYGVTAVLLWRGVAAATAVALGLAGFSTGLWTQSIFALGGRADAASITSTTTCLAGIGLSALTFALLWLIPRAFSWRHSTSLAFAGASLAPAVVFAAAPAQALAVAIAMAVGSTALVAGTVAVGRGRTWGLLVNLLGATIVAVGVTFAPWLGYLSTVHPWLPNGVGFLVSVLGISAATLAALSSAVYVGPLVAFLRRG